jgi:hypothetical protein
METNMNIVAANSGIEFMVSFVKIIWVLQKLKGGNQEHVQHCDPIGAKPNFF